jgi:hypothetical protein
MRNTFLLLIILILTPGLKAQQIYCDFEGVKVIYFGDCSGKIDSLFSNPSQSYNDSSLHCARYVRDTALYDNIKLYTTSRIENADQYANNNSSVPKIKMKLYSSLPIGTTIQLQLGSSLNNNYPGGIHSEYSTVTTTQNNWETLTFNYLQSPAGGLTSSANLDKIVLLFYPGSNNADTIYFDDIVGPALVPLNVQSWDGISEFKLHQNVPNPAKEITHINLQLSTPGYVSLKLFDMIGNPVTILLDQNMKAGNYSIPVDTGNIPDGIYFYTLKMDGVSRSMKMIVSK